MLGGERAGLLDEAGAECDAALRLLAEAGLVWRYGASAGGERAARVRERLERELGILADKNISAYFRLWDFVNWGRQQGIQQQRGSGVGTMVECLGSERVGGDELFQPKFLDGPEKYPTSTSTCARTAKGEVIDTCAQVRGAARSSFRTLKARGGAGCRVQEVSLSEADRLAKMIPEALGMTLAEALAQEPDLKRLYEEDQAVRRVIDHARVLEGQARHASVHAAGVIVATRPLHEIVPLYRQTGSDEHEVVTQWDGPTCERMGLLKMDSWGCGDRRCKRLIREGLSEIWRAVGSGEEQGATGGGRAAWLLPRRAPGAAPTLRPRPVGLRRPDRVEMFRRGDDWGVPVRVGGDAAAAGGDEAGSS